MTSWTQVKVGRNKTETPPSAKLPPITDWLSAFSFKRVVAEPTLQSPSKRPESSPGWIRPECNLPPRQGPSPIDAARSLGRKLDRLLACNASEHLKVECLRSLHAIAKGIKRADATPLSVESCVKSQVIGTKKWFKVLAHHAVEHEGREQHFGSVLAALGDANNTVSRFLEKHTLAKGKT